MNRGLSDALSTSVAIALIAGCGGSQPPVGAPSVMRSNSIGGQSHIGYDAKGPFLYVTNYVPWTVTVYHAGVKDPSPIATITQGLNDPAGACIDGQGTVYITNQPNASAGWVSEYPLGETTPSKVITKGVDVPGYCAIDGNENLWVTNIAGANVTEYLHGSKQPHMVITEGVPHPVGIAIDQSGNLCG